ncbi:MAG: DNA cytosine methyltransferase [Thermosipho sp. (in: Bacteria)]|nr:DNA cytosine methyltransferase [Thermosipho sp. (in: thermotogales)]
MIFKKGELFCGPGGLALGAKQARVVNEGEEYKIEHVWANDIDSSACKTYIENICPDKPDSVKCEDVRGLNIEELEEIDALTFGFPCNDFSIVGEQRGFEGKYGPLYTYGVKVLDCHNPKWFLAENVGGLKSANEGRAFEVILNDLANAGKYGYEITAHLYKFEEYGVPQTRHRIIIVGIRRDLNLRFRVPAPTTQNRYKTAREALENPPIPPDAPNNEKTKHPRHIVERLRHIPPGENAWYEGIPEHLRLKVKGAKLSNIYRRLHPDKPAYTVTGSGGGGTHMYHYSEPRALTNRERARLQDFPDDFIFYGSKEEVRKQIGMAVPPTVARIIFEAILKTFAGIRYDSVEARWDIETQQ